MSKGEQLKLGASIIRGSRIRKIRFWEKETNKEVDAASRDSYFIGADGQIYELDGDAIVPTSDVAAYLLVEAANPSYVVKGLTEGTFKCHVCGDEHDIDGLIIYDGKGMCVECYESY